MKFGDYLKEKIPLICAYFSVLILILIVLLAFNLYYTGIIMIMFLLFVLGIILFFYQFYQKKLFYDKLYILLGDLDNKALIHETVGEASFIDGRILLDILRETDKYKLEQINKYKYMQEEFQEFMELWVHEIKTPLAAINLICENNKSKVTNSINEESLKILLEKFKKHEIEKHYLALVYGIPNKKEEKAVAYLFKDKKKAQVYIRDTFKTGYQKIITKYTVLEKRKDDTALLDVEIETGRTHQIRAHLAYMGYPIIGDGKYGKNEINKQFNRKYQMLCSYKLKFNFCTESGILDYLKGKEIRLNLQKNEF